MTNYKEILRVTAQGLSQRNTALACGVSRNTVMDVDRRCRIQQLTWAEAQNMENEEIKNRLFPNDHKQRDQTFRLPDFAHIHAELAKPHVTLMLLWEEYCQASRKAGERHYQYTQFRKYYADYAIKDKVTIRIEHKPGELMEVDWAGTRPQYQDPGTGLFVKASLFVSVLPASQIVYAEAFADEKLSSWIDAHTHAFRYFGGIPRAITPDNLKTGVTGADWYSPIIQRTYQEMATYYGTVVLPARPLRPKDYLQNWIIFRNRNISSNSTNFQAKIEDNN